MEDLVSDNKLNQYVDAQNQTGLINSERLVWGQLISTIALRIRESLSLPTILQTTADEVQQLLGCDRVLVYQFAPDWSGQVLVEAVSSPQWTLLNRVVRDNCFEARGLEPYQANQFTVIADIANVTKLSPCYIGFLNQFQIKANLVIPILNKSQLWGLLIAQSCTAPRQWLPEEINGLQQISVHVGIAIHQADLLAQLQAAKADLEAQVEVRTSELQKTNQQLLQSETRFLEISESSPSVIYIYVQRGDGSIYFEHISRAIEDLLRISVNQILENAMTLFDRIYPDDLANYLAAVQRSQETLQPFQHEWRMIATSGEIKWIKGNSRPKLRANGEIAWHGVVIDIGVRKRAELALIASEEKAKTILGAIPDLLLRVSRDGFCLDFITSPSNTTDRFVPIKQHLSELLPPDLLQTQLQAIEKAIATNELQVYNHQLLKFGKLAYEEVSVTPINEDEALIIVRDITDRRQAEIALRENEIELRKAYDEQKALFSAIPDVVLIRNKEGQCIKVVPTNQQKLLGTPEEVLNKSIYEELPQSAANTIMMAIRESLTTQKITSCDYILEIDGQEIWFAANISPIDDDKVIQLSRDITERKLGELNLKRSEEKYRHLIDNLHAGFVVHAPNTSVIVCNSKACDLLGLSLDQMMGKRAIDPDWRFYCEDGTLMPLEEYPVNQVLSTGLPLINYVLRINRGDRTQIWVLVNAFPEFDDHQQIQQIAISFIDISDRKNAELETKQVQNFLNSIIENIPNMLFVKDAKNLQFVRFNKAGEELLGYSKEALIGKSDYDFFPHEEANFFISKDQEVLQNKKIVDIPEELIQTKNQGQRILHTKKIPILDESGAPKYLLGISEDITERQQAKLALQESESRFQKIALSSPGGIYILIRSLDGSFHFEYVSSAFENIFEMTVEQVLKDFNTYKNMIHPDDLVAYQEAVTSSIENIYPFNHEWRIITPTKKLKWVQARSSLEIRDDATMAWYGVLLDITDQKEGEQRLNQIANHIPGMIYQYRLRPDGSSHFPYSSDGIREIYGVTPEQVEEDAAAAFMAIHSDDLERIATSILESAANLTPWHCEYRVCHPNEPITWVLGHSSPQKELDGSIIWYGYISDISDRKQVEIDLAKAKETAEAATKAKSQFLANMSHEIRTPMNGVLGMAELLANTNLTEEQQDIVQTIRDSGDILLVVINDILDFSKIESGMLQLEEHPFMLKDLIASICHLLSKQAVIKNIAIEYTISPDIPTNVIGDSTRLRQILINLVGNAIKFTENGMINIAITKNQPQENKKLDGELDGELDGKVALMISIKDQGIGIDGDRINKLFQPFTQADDSISRKYGGTGLGLAISKSLVGLMGGTIWAESRGNIAGKPAKNWTLDTETSELHSSSFYFTIVLKVVAETEIEAPTTPIYPQQDANVDQSQLKILLAEDNPFNQKVATMMLKRLGYIVDIANNGLEVLEMLEKQFYDVILMDMQMPEMDGVTATQIIRQSNKRQPWIIALTANALEEDRRICLAVGMNDFVSKPIPMKELQRMILEYSQSNQ